MTDMDRIDQARMLVRVVRDSGEQGELNRKRLNDALQHLDELARELKRGEGFR